MPPQVPTMIRFLVFPSTLRGTIIGTFRGKPLVFPSTFHGILSVPHTMVLRSLSLSVSYTYTKGGFGVTYLP